LQLVAKQSFRTSTITFISCRSVKNRNTGISRR
jgi:hypothetical protein